MKKLTLLCLLLFFGCEMHEQENIVQGETEARVVNLSLLEELTTAIVQNDVSYVIEKLSVGSFEINVPNKEGELILNKAVENKRLTIGYYLIKGGANPDSEDDEGESARMLAELSDQTEAWEAIFDLAPLKEDVANAAIFKLLTDSKPETEEKFIPSVDTYLNQLGAHIDGRNGGNFTYLMEASSRRLLGMVKLFCLHPDIDPNIKVERGRGRRKQTFTALSLSKNFPEIQEELIKCGAVE